MTKRKKTLTIFRGNNQLIDVNNSYNRLIDITLQRFFKQSKIFSGVPDNDNNDIKHEALTVSMNTFVIYMKGYILFVTAVGEEEN